MTPPKKPSPPTPSSTSATPPDPARPTGPLGRVRIEDMGQRLRRDPLPLLYLLGFVILAGTLAYLYNNPATPPGVQQAAVRVDSLQGQVQTLTDRLAKLENRPASAASDLAPLDRRIAALEGRPPVNLAPLEGRVAAVENRPAPPPVNLQPLEARIAALEGKPPPAPFDPAPLTAQIGAVTAKEAADATALGGRLDALGAKQAADIAALSGRLDSEAAKQAAAVAAAAGALDARVAAVDAQAKQTASQIGAVAERSGRVTRMQAALSALQNGQPLGSIPDAPPAVAHFATQAPPTEADLRRSFDAAADAAQQAGQPALMNQQRTFGDRLWARAQQAVTVRQSDRVLVGDPLAGKLILARAALDAGDLAGAVKALDGLAGPAQAAMADWIGQARAVLDARTALSSMAART